VPFAGRLVPRQRPSTTSRRTPSALTRAAVRQIPERWNAPSIRVSFHAAESEAILPCRA
jgi:hypothetical protein